MQASHITGLPVVDSINVDGRVIPVSCGRNYSGVIVRQGGCFVPSDWEAMRQRAADNVAELRGWLQDGMTDDDDLRVVIALLVKQQAWLRVCDALVGRCKADVMRVAWERGEDILWKK